MKDTGIMLRIQPVLDIRMRKPQANIGSQAFLSDILHQWNRRVQPLFSDKLHQDLVIGYIHVSPQVYLGSWRIPRSEDLQGLVLHLPRLFILLLLTPHGIGILTWSTG
jgi:hypothetical protein